MRRGIVSMIMSPGRRSGKSLAARYIDTSRLMRSPGHAQIDRAIAEAILVETVQFAAVDLRIGARRSPGLPSGPHRPRPT